MREGGSEEENWGKKREDGTGIKGRKEGNEVIKGQETENLSRYLTLCQAVVLAYVLVIFVQGVLGWAGMRKKMGE